MTFSGWPTGDQSSQEKITKGYWVNTAQLLLFLSHCKWPSPLSWAKCCWFYNLDKKDERDWIKSGWPSATRGGTKHARWGVARLGDGWGLWRPHLWARSPAAPSWGCSASCTPVGTAGCTEPWWVAWRSWRTGCCYQCSRGTPAGKESTKKDVRMESQWVLMSQNHLFCSVCGRLSPNCSCFSASSVQVFSAECPSLVSHCDGFATSAKERSLSCHSQKMKLLMQLNYAFFSWLMYKIVPVQFSLQLFVLIDIYFFPLWFKNLIRLPLKCTVTLPSITGGMN